ncbi:MAG: DoxX family protein [Xanthobacteraceae bacterium]
MHILFAVGRVLLVLIFIFSGARKLLDLPGTTAMISGYVTVPDALSGFATQLQETIGLTVPQLLAILVGTIELVGGLLIAFNIATRGAAAVLALFTLLTIFYAHNFWSMAGDALQTNLIHAMKNLSIMGGLLTFAVLGSWRPTRSND